MKCSFHYWLFFDLLVESTTITQAPLSYEALHHHHHNLRHPHVVGRKGPTKEVEDVEAKLAEMRSLEGVVERDLAAVLASVQNHSLALLHMENVLGAAAVAMEAGDATAAAGVDRSSSSLTDSLAALAAVIRAHPSNLTDLSRGLLAMRRDLAVLVRSLNASELELREVREVTGQKEIIDGLLGGKVEIDYETGKIGSVSGGQRLTHLANLSGSWRANALSGQVDAAKVAADPAVLHLDVQLLQDMVVLCLATAVGGLLAALVDLPHTLGYILGGMLVGPSCVNFIDRVVQVETLAQFGSIFMLFGHGLVYSQHYRATAIYLIVGNEGGGGVHRRDRSRSGSDDPEAQAYSFPPSAPLVPQGGAYSISAPQSLPSPTHQIPTGSSSPVFLNEATAYHSNSDAPKMQVIYNDTATGGFLFVVSLFVVTLVLVKATSIVSSWLEGTLLALAMALSSTSIVMDTLVQTHLRETLYGTVVIEIMAIQVSGRYLLYAHFRS